jgi:hypothetical protein
MAKKQGSAAGGKNRKIGRSKRKAEGRGKPLSLFVRNKISAEEYFKKSNQHSKKC